jgi:hypothetical protein
MIAYEKELKEILAMIETSLNLLKEGKVILAFNKMQGVKQKLAIIYNSIKTNENDINK